MPGPDWSPGAHGEAAHRGLARDEEVQPLARLEAGLGLALGHLQRQPLHRGREVLDGDNLGSHGPGVLKIFMIYSMLLLYRPITISNFILLYIDHLLNLNVPFLTL